MIQHGDLTPIDYLGRKLFLDLTQPHERKYAGAIENGRLFPQMDIDDMVFKIFLRRGASCLDAGSNIGLTAMQMLARGASRVVCVEPDPSLVTRLIKNLDGDALIVEAALIPSLKDREKFGKLYLSDAHNQGSTLCEEILQMFPSLWNKERRVIEPRLITLADIVSQYGRFDFWKLDIEGLEIPVIKEALSVLSSELHPDFILFESYKDIGEVCLLADSLVEYIFFQCSVQSKSSRLELTSFASMIGAPVRKGESRRAGTSPMYLALRLCDLGEFVSSIASHVPFGPLDSCTRNLCNLTSFLGDCDSDLKLSVDRDVAELKQQLAGQSAKVQEAQKARDAQAARVKALEAEKAAAAQEAEDLKQQLEAQIGQLQEAQQARDQQAERVKALEAENAAAAQSVEDLKQQLEVQTQALEQLKAELAGKSAALAQAEAALSQVSGSLRQLVQR